MISEVLVNESERKISSFSFIKVETVCEMKLISVVTAVRIISH